MEPQVSKAWKTILTDMQHGNKNANVKSPYNCLYLFSLSPWQRDPDADFAEVSRFHGHFSVSCEVVSAFVFLSP